MRPCDQVLYSSYEVEMEDEEEDDALNQGNNMNRIPMIGTKRKCATMRGNEGAMHNATKKGGDV